MYTPSNVNKQHARIAMFYRIMWKPFNGTNIDWKKITRHIINGKRLFKLNYSHCWVNRISKRCVIYNQIVIVLTLQRIENNFIILICSRLLNLFFKFFFMSCSRTWPDNTRLKNRSNTKTSRLELILVFVWCRRINDKQLQIFR